MAPNPAITGTRKVTDGDIPRILATIQHFESGNYTIDSHPSGATASGAYQYVNGTWKSNASQVPGAAQYPRAFEAPPDIQDKVAANNVRNILTANGYDLSAVPVHWYYPVAWNNPSALESAPPGNRLTVRDYATRWVAFFNQANPANTALATAIAQRLSVPFDPTATSSTTTLSTTPSTSSDGTQSILTTISPEDLIPNATGNTTVLGTVHDPTAPSNVDIVIHPLPAVNKTQVGSDTLPAAPDVSIVAWANTTSDPRFLSYVNFDGVFVGPNGSKIGGVSSVDLSDAIKAILNKIPNPLSGIEAVGAFFSKLSQASTWVAIGQVVGGLALVGGALLLVAKDQVSSVVTKVGKVAAL